MQKPLQNNDQSFSLTDEDKANTLNAYFLQYLRSMVQIIHFQYFAIKVIQQLQELK